MEREHLKKKNEVKKVHKVLTFGGRRLIYRCLHNEKSSRLFLLGRGMMRLVGVGGSFILEFKNSMQKNAKTERTTYMKAMNTFVLPLVFLFCFFFFLAAPCP